MNSRRLYLYTSVGCHLCEQASALLHHVLGAESSMVQAVEIADSDALMARYGIRIPVLACEHADGQWRELGWPFDAEMLKDFLQLQNEQAQ